MVAKSQTQLGDFHFHSLELPVVQHLKGTAFQIFKKYFILEESGFTMLR